MIRSLTNGFQERGGGWSRLFLLVLVSALPAALFFPVSGSARELTEEEFHQSSVRARTALYHDPLLDAPLDLGDFEAIEGFWIRRPWLLEAACPAAPARPEPSDASSPSIDEDESVPALEEREEGDQSLSPPIQRIGIAHFYTANDSRTLRREHRAYQATRKLAADEEPSSDGYDLVLSGRLSRMPDGRIIVCAGRNPSRPPTCIVSVTFDRVALRRPDGALVAEWSSG